MKLNIHFRGSETPFEGNRELLIKELPAGAKILHAKAIVTPVPKPGGAPFVERILFQNGAGEWGATKTKDNVSWVEVDFHNRRTLHTVQGKSAVTATLQVDMGGAFVGIANDGTFHIPGQTTVLQVNLDSIQKEELPGLTVTKFRLSRNSGGIPDIREITVISHPTNVSLRLDQMQPFYTDVGEMTEAEIVPDFAEILQAYLQEAEAQNGFYVVPLVVHSDIIARLDIRLEIEFSRQINVLPDGLEEVNLPFDFGSLPQTPEGLLTVSLPAGARVLPKETAATVIGAFQESRVVFGSTGVITAQSLVAVKPSVSQAQPIVVNKETPVTAFDILLASASRTVTLDVNLLPDSDGKPFDDPLLPQPVAIRLDRDTAGSLTWISAQLSREFLFKPGERYWLVVQALDGEAVWGADPLADSPGATGLQFTSSGGLAWRQTVDQNIAGPLAAFFRLRYTPVRFQMPIELQVGEGAMAQRVSLERFQPLGRVDFVLDFEEVAEAFNTYLQRVSRGASPEVEHLVNGDFERWMSISEERGVSGMNSLRLAAPPKARIPADVAASPFGATVYVISHKPLEETEPPIPAAGYFQIFYRPCGESFELKLSEANPLVFAINPAGTRAYVISEKVEASFLHVVDIVNLREIGSMELAESAGTAKLSGRATDIEVHPNGEVLYLSIHSIPGSESTEIGKVWGINAIELEEVLNSTANLSRIDEVKIADINLNYDEAIRLPEDLEISPDGKLLYLAVRNFSGGGEFHIINTESQTILTKEDFVPFNGEPTKMALSPDGSFAVILGDGILEKCEGGDFDHFASIIDTELRREVENSPFCIKSGEPPVDVVISSDGKLAYIALADFGNWRIVPLSLDTVEDQVAIPLNNRPKALAITPPGEILFATTTASDEDWLVSIQLNIQRPVEWEGTSGNISPVRLPNPTGLGMLLGFPEDFPGALTSAISQVVPVSGGGGYCFEFSGIACKKESLAEVFWIGDQCVGVQSHQIAITPFEAGDEPFIITTARHLLKSHRLLMQAPANATQAEVRFLVPPGNVAIIDQVSLATTNETLANSSLRMFPEQEAEASQIPLHWRVSPEDYLELMIRLADDRIEIRNRGSETAALIQESPVKAGQPFVLQFRGFSERPAASRNNITVEGHWFSGEGREIGTPAKLDITVADIENPVLEGLVPEGATRAEIQLVIPPGFMLAVEEVSLRILTTIEVPITFIAQSPGEMTVSNARVAYDIVPPPPPTVAAEGLCPTTPPGRAFGETPQNCCYCSCCACEREMVNTTAIRTSNNRPAMVGNCPECGEKLLTYGGDLNPAAKPVSLSSLNLAGKGKPRPVVSRIIPKKSTKSASAILPEKIAFSAPAESQPALKPEKPKKVKETSKVPKLPSPKEQQQNLATAIHTMLQDPELRPLENYKLNTILSLSLEKLYERLKK